jgi:hypothetical protein
MHEDDQPLGSRRELESLRQRYHDHRRSIRHLLQTAPDARLAARYERMLEEIQRSVDQLDLLDKDPFPDEPEDVDDPASPEPTPHLPRVTPAVPPRKGSEFDTIAVRSEKAPFDQAELDAGSRSWKEPVVNDATLDQRVDRGPARWPWVVGLVLLAILAAGVLFFWLGEGDDPANIDRTIVEDGLGEPSEPAPPPSLLTAEPASYDFGVIPKGNRSVHRFTIRNSAGEAIPISVSRSDCRCLWYDYPAQIPPNESVELSITVDGARASEGSLTETVRIESERLPDAVATIELTAEIRAR